MPSSGFTRCAVCETVFANDAPEMQEASMDTGCPACGSTSVPHDPAHDVTLTINWHDLRCLAIWAENYVLASKADPQWERAWEAIKRRLRSVQPEGAAGLTLFDEIQQIRDEGYDVTLHDGNAHGSHPFGALEPDDDDPEADHAG